MRSFRDLPIRQKLMVITMVTSGSTLGLAILALLAWDFIRVRDEINLDLATQAQIIVDNSTAAVSFDDPDAAGETLASLRAKPPIIAACIYRATGQVLATYSADGSRVACPPPQLDGIDTVNAGLAVFKQIVLSGKPVGTLYMLRTLTDFRQRLGLQALVVSGVLFGSGIVAVLLSSAVRRLIAGPLIDLAHTARAVSERKDYSVRARRHGDDELGALVDAFNGMLEQIEARDSELQQAKETLEERVEERTVALQRELGERRRAEQQLEVRNLELTKSNKELDDFAYIASHDLKEPLRGIHNYSVFLKQDYSDKIDEEGQIKLETVARLSRRMEALIDSLLRFSRVGRVDLALEAVDLNPVVAEILDSLQISLRDYDVEVRIPRPLPTIRCDRVRVGEVFHNLVTNAMKYNDKPVKWIEIGSCDPSAAGGPAEVPERRRVPVFYVRDNGIGIPEKHHESIFRIFKRLHARDKYGGGTGAGLTIVRKIVERHNGRVWIESAVDQGTTVYFTLAPGA